MVRISGGERWLVGQVMHYLGTYQVDMLPMDCVLSPKTERWFLKQEERKFYVTRHTSFGTLVAAVPAVIQTRSLLSMALAAETRYQSSPINCRRKCPDRSAETAARPGWYLDRAL